MFLWSDRLVIDRLPVVGVTGETLRRALAGSLDAWGMADYVLERTGAGSWAATLYPVSRLATLGEPRHVDGLPAAEADSGRLRVLVGRGLDEEVWVDLSETSGLLVAGMPGSGKTQGMLVIAAGLLSLPNHVDLYVSDGKAAGDWSWLSPYCETYTDDLDGTLDMLRRVRELMEERLRRGRDSGHPDFWDGFGRDRVDGGRNGRAVVVVLDEVQTWAMPVTADRADKARAAEFVRLASDIVRRGRAAGVCLIMGTQKPTSDAIPTGLRDMCGLRVAFRCSTPEMAKAALGALPDGETRSRRHPEIHARSGRDCRRYWRGVLRTVRPAVPQHDCATAARFALVRRMEGGGLTLLVFSLCGGEKRPQCPRYDRRHAAQGHSALIRLPIFS